MGGRSGAGAGSWGGPPHEELLARAVVRTGGIDAQDRARLREAAAHAAGNGTPLRELIDAYLGALCRTCAPSAGGAGGGCAVSVPVPAQVLGPVREVAVTLTEGYEAAHRAAIRREEEIRQAFLDELLHGAGDLGRMAEQAHRIGFRFAGPHRVAVARAEAPFSAADPATRYVEEAMASGYGAGESLVAAKDGMLVCICAGSGASAAEHFAEHVRRSLARHPRIAVSRPRPGANGVVRCYREARETLDLAHRLAVSGAVIHASDLLVFQVLGRDRAAITDLVATVLGGLERARGGPGPLLHTLTAYFDSGCTNTVTARRLGLSVRTVAYRMARVRTLTGYDPANPDQRYTLQTATLGARLLNWPALPLQPSD
ncbi:PucR family transcriptional regulator [Streptomyces gossypiisoli]|uniref:PucR family transcriptional regulator n=1 Tax=Streptomyces gossypiisoli TaxID=2748864 RepID=UPI0015DA190E|nr:helix-turn-helix domain-containing protein [Streptomyces gossypiisoli]